jgi:hypothetical protein
MEPVVVVVVVVVVRERPVVVVVVVGEWSCYRSHSVHMRLRFLLC